MDGLQAGYRHISLRTEGNIPLPLSTLFCHIVLKTYVPDGLGGFVEALNDPRKYITNEEKRQKQMQEKLGIDEKDIVPSLEKGSKSIKTNSMHASRAITSGSGDVSSKKVTGGAGEGSAGVAAGGAEAAGTAGAGAAAAGSGVAGGAGASGVAAVVSSRREEPQIERITRESLKVVKGFQKLLKKQAKEKDGLKKKHNKERALMQKQHSAIIDKMNASNCKQSSGVLIGAGGVSSVASVSTTYVNNSSNLNSVNANSSATLVATATAPNGQVNNGNTPTTTLFVFSDSIASASAASGTGGANANDDHNENSFKAKVNSILLLLKLLVFCVFRCFGCFFFVILFMCLCLFFYLDYFFYFSERSQN